MPTPSRQLLSRTIYDTDGSTTDWEFAFSGGYLSTSHVKAQVTDALGIVTEITVLPAMLTNAFTLRIVPALAAGSELTIYRDTPKDLPIVDFTDEAGFTEIALDTNAKQAIFVAAEATDAAANLTDASAAATTALQAADQAAASAAAAAADSASVNAALNVLSGFTVALRASGTGSQTVFPVAAPSGNIAMTVFVNGIYQQRNTWSFSGTVVTFTEAPVAGTNNIEFVLDVSQPITQVPSTSVSTQRFGVADGTTTVTLEQPIASQASVQGIYLNGLYQQKDSYSVNGDLVTFVTPLEAGVLEVVVYDADIAQFTGNNLTTQNVEFPAVGGTVSRTLDSKLRESVSVKDFGAVGDGNPASASINTAAINRAIAYMNTTGANVVVPPGVYVCDPFVLSSVGYSTQGTFIGIDRERCVFKRNTSGASAFITVGAASSSILQSGIGMRHIKIDGGATSNGPAFRGYDIVRSHFQDVQFSGGSIACDMQGGISVTFTACLFEAALIGVKINKFSSAAGGGWPNAIHFVGGEIVDNVELGAWVDGGRQITFSHIDIEGNGTTLGAALQGGVWVGTSIGQEVSVNDTFNQGVLIDACWFEANRGAADLFVGGGNTSVTRTLFFSSAAQTTNDMRFDGGQFYVSEVNCSFAKGNNLIEGAGTLAGSHISNSQIPNISRNILTTSIATGAGIDMRGGTVPVVQNATKPAIQSGNGATAGGSGVATIFFPTAYAVIPTVFCTALDNAVGRVASIKLKEVTPDYFTVEGTIIPATGGAPVLSEVSFVWQALGQGL